LKKARTRNEEVKQMVRHKSLFIQALILIVVATL
jgi:hypothetical protein